LSADGEIVNERPVFCSDCFLKALCLVGRFGGHGDALRARVRHQLDLSLFNRTEAEIRLNGRPTRSRYNVRNSTSHELLAVPDQPIAGLDPKALKIVIGRIAIHVAGEIAKHVFALAKTDDVDAGVLDDLG
jgi:hypothetical protein